MHQIRGRFTAPSLLREKAARLAVSAETKDPVVLEGRVYRVMY
jgi:hypothetical protein